MVARKGKGAHGAVILPDGSYARTREHLERRKLWRKRLRELGLSRDEAEVWSTGAARFRVKLRELGKEEG